MSTEVSKSPRKKPLTKADVIRMTSETLRSFYNRDPGATMTYLAENFMWIGAFDFQWCEGVEECLRITRSEYAEAPVLISDEEYHLLFHDRNTWVIYGRYKTTVVLEDDAVIHFHVRVTAIWRRINGELKLVHIHGSNAQDIPANQLAPSLHQFTEETSFFDYVKRIDMLNANANKITLRDQDGKYHFLLPDDILYIKADGHYTTVHTKKCAFSVSGLLSDHEEHLPPQFRRIQRSYVVNTQYIDTICRYTAVLKTGEKLPIGKSWYTGLKNFLQQGKETDCTGR